jgi:hypothetical protein
VNDQRGLWIKLLLTVLLLSTCSAPTPAPAATDAPAATEMPAVAKAPAATEVPPTETPAASEALTPGLAKPASEAGGITARMLVEPGALMGSGPSGFGWSPQGAILAYVEPLDGRDVLWAYDPVTSEKWALLDPGDNPDQIDLSSEPNGRRRGTCSCCQEEPPSGCSTRKLAN